MANQSSIIIFTKTNWDEPPRIRHQLTRLLYSHGHKIIFFEKSSFRQLKTIKHQEEGINFIKHFELIHHQLRPLKLLVKLNQTVTKYLIRKNLIKENIDFILNFNYDYSFLRDLFPNKRIITIINDDFVAQAKPWMIDSIYEQLKTTCKHSDMIFAVSYPLCEQLKQFNKNTYILLPWAERKYRLPTITQEKRNVVLYWGYIDHRLNWNVIDHLINNNIKLRFVGDVGSNIKNKIEKYTYFDNFELLPSTDINKLNMEDVCCSILPYDTKRAEMRVVTVNNRVFRLLSYGIPLIYSDLPYLIETPNTVITKCKSNEDYINAIDYFSSSFSSSQTDIEKFLMDHYSDIRYNYLLEKINSVQK